MNDYTHNTQKKIPNDSKALNRFIIWQGVALFLQVSFALVPLLFFHQVAFEILVIIGIIFSIACFAITFPKVFDNSKNIHIIPFIGVALCALTIALSLAHPIILIYIAAWVLLVSLGERRAYYNPIYLISFVAFTIAALTISILYLSKEPFSTTEIVLSFAGGIVLSFTHLFFLYRQLKSGGQIEAEPASNSQEPSSLQEAMTAILKAEESLENTLWRISQECIPLIGLEDCVIYLHDPKPGILIQVAAYGNKTPDGSEIVLSPIEISPGKGVVGECFSSGTTLLVEDLSKFEGYIVDDAKRNSELAVPIFNRGVVIGVIDSEHSQKAFFTDEHVKAFEKLAEFCELKFRQSTGY